jgi:hypothetical protein
MNINAKVQFQIELTEEEYRVIQAFRALDEIQREAWMSHLEHLERPPVQGISGKELAARLERWRQDLTEEERREMREALAVLDT